LKGKEYAFSRSYLCDTEDIFDIHKMLKAIRWYIERILKEKKK
jgi:hypothetical protein